MEWNVRFACVYRFLYTCIYMTCFVFASLRLLLLLLLPNSACACVCGIHFYQINRYTSHMYKIVLRAERKLFKLNVFQMNFVLFWWDTLCTGDWGFIQFIRQDVNSVFSISAIQQWLERKRKNMVSHYFAFFFQE